jgi:hypothetical protein
VDSSLRWNDESIELTLHSNSDKTNSKLFFRVEFSRGGLMLDENQIEARKWLACIRDGTHRFWPIYRYMAEAMKKGNLSLYDIGTSPAKLVQYWKRCKQLRRGRADSKSAR